MLRKSSGANPRFMSKQNRDS